MKKILLIVLAVVAVLGVGVLSVDHYKNYQNKKAQDHKVAVDKEVVAVKKAAGAEYASLQTAYDKMRLECEKGVAAYGLLTAFNKTKTPQPVCGPAVVPRS